MDTVLPYIGSKKRIVNILKQNLPQHDLYVEPFAGGFSLGLELLKLGVISKAHVNDLKEGVADFWYQVKNNPSVLHEDIVKTKDIINSLGVENRVDFIFPSFGVSEYIQRVSNKGMYFKKLPLEVNLKNNLKDVLLSASRLMRDSDISCTSYSNLRYLDRPETFWYFDPPYHGYNNSSFYGMSKSDDFNQEKLVLFLKSLKGNFILSNSNTKYTKNLYRDFYVYEVYIKSKGSGRYTQDLLVSNFSLSIPDEFILSCQSAREQALILKRKDELYSRKRVTSKRKYKYETNYSLNTINLFD